MSLKITANTLATNRYLEVHGNGVSYNESALFSNVRNFTFNEIDFILLSEDNVLSFQVKQEVFSIPINPNKEKHKQVIDTLIREVTRIH